jgi:hypothetical protein
MPARADGVNRNLHFRAAATGREGPWRTRSDKSDFCEDILRNTIAFPFVPHCLAERSHELVA